MGVFSTITWLLQIQWYTLRDRGIINYIRSYHNMVYTWCEINLMFSREGI